MKENQPQFTEKEIHKLVIAELRKYKVLKIQLANLKERNRAGMSDLFPIIRERDEKNYLKVNQIERAIEESLDTLERELIEKKYLSTQDPTDLEVYLEMGIKKAKYYAKKKEALNSIATALGMI
ncbi:ArpU family phage packaging/lysis transcriptional regulator [Peribacillus deserti]|uniref:ArpU family transcriptional regulator n=1 Tax=Peribacillus deserti TaxID=673318 RepID=A0A2N5M8M5_9BACI|nr:ArpU family phage packaging/lysis transcriptional regulator [Peribacillus deserti]PLT30709.1 ArpU family transcriptional regulator [Peribacillus deserti]